MLQIRLNFLLQRFLPTWTKESIYLQHSHNKTLLAGPSFPQIPEALQKSIAGKVQYAEFVRWLAVEDAEGVNPNEQAQRAD